MARILLAKATSRSRI